MAGGSMPSTPKITTFGYSALLFALHGAANRHLDISDVPDDLANVRVFQGAALKL
jgi:hypothetical protein